MLLFYTCRSERVNGCKRSIYMEILYCLLASTENCFIPPLSANIAVDCTLARVLGARRLRGLSTHTLKGNIIWWESDTLKRVGRFYDLLEEQTNTGDLRDTWC